MAQLDRSVPPPPGPAPEVKLGEYSRFELPNGLKVFVVENHKTPFVTFSLIIDNDPVLQKENCGYVQAVGDLLRGGTKNRSKDQLDNEIDFIGATVNASSNNIYAASLKKHFEKLLEIVSDITLNSDFKQEELDKIKAQTISGLAAQKEEPSVIASRVRKKLLYGTDHPYSESPTEETVANYTLDLCVDYYDKYFRPNNAYIAIVGAISKEEAEKLINKYFSKWEKGEIIKHEYKKPKTNLVPKIAIVDRPSAVQSTINICHIVNLTHDNPDVIGARVTNTVLGGGVFRLFKNLREIHSYTYGAYSNLSPDKLIGYFNASTDVRNSVTDSAITEILKEMKRIGSEIIPSDELQNVKNYVSGNFALSLENPQTAANFAINIERYNLPKDFYKDYLKNVEALNSETAKELAKKYIQPDKSFILVVGKADEIADKLKQFSPAPIEYYDIYGNKIDKSAQLLPEGLTVEKLIEEHIQAIGGRKNIENIKDKSTFAEGEMMGQSINVSIYQKSPDKYHQNTSIGSMMEIKIYVNGDQGYQSSPMGNKFFTKEELDMFKIEGDIQSILKMKDYYSELKLTGITKINGKDAYKVEKVDFAGNKSISYIDADSKLYIKEEKAIKTEQGEFMQTIEFDDYREVAGVKFPYKLIQSVGPQRITLNVSKIDVNTNISDDLFKIPTK